MKPLLLVGAGGFARETLELVRAYYKVADPQVRRRLFELTKALAKAPGAEAE